MRLLGLLLLPACELEKSDPGRTPIPPDERPKLDDTGGDGQDSGDPVDPGPDDSGDPGDSGPGDGTVPAEACHPDLEGWPEEWAALEEKVLERINEERANGADCGKYGTFGPAGHVEMDEDLRCAARYHSLWMAQNDVLAHESPGGDLGDDPWERIASTDFSGSAIGENVAAGYPSAASVVQGWMGSDGHCSNVMNPSATLTGIGYYQGGGSYTHWWTQNFGL